MQAFTSIHFLFPLQKLFTTVLHCSVLQYYSTLLHNTVAQSQVYRLENILKFCIYAVIIYCYKYKKDIALTRLFYNPISVLL